MTIKQALKEKNKLVKKISELNDKISTYNTIEVGNKRPYVIQDLFNELTESIKNLVELKTSIHKANEPVYHLIFRLSELKSLVSKLKTLSCGEGTFGDRYSRMRETPIIMESEFDIVRKDTLVLMYESEIEKIQEELDTHNATKHI